MARDASRKGAAETAPSPTTDAVQTPRSCTHIGVQAGHRDPDGRHMIVSITRWSLAHKRLVVLIWLTVTAIGIASAGAATKAL